MHFHFLAAADGLSAGAKSGMGLNWWLGNLFGLMTWAIVQENSKRPKDIHIYNMIYIYTILYIYILVISSVHGMFFTWVGLNWWLATLCGVMPLFWVLEENERSRDKI